MQYWDGRSSYRLACPSGRGSQIPRGGRAGDSRTGICTMNYPATSRPPITQAIERLLDSDLKSRASKAWQIVVRLRALDLAGYDQLATAGVDELPGLIDRNIQDLLGLGVRPNFVPAPNVSGLLTFLYSNGSALECLERLLQTDPEAAFLNATTKPLVIDANAHTITVWGDRFEIKHAPTFQLFRKVADADGNLVLSSEIKKTIPGCKGRLDVMLSNHLRPNTLRQLIQSKKGHGGGYWLVVPDCAQWRAMVRNET